MSEALDTTEPTRGRQPRADAVAGQRRRRRDGTLNRMVQFKLDFIPPEDLDLDNYVYHWANDEGSNLRMMTMMDDYDHVSVEELGPGFDINATDSESDHRVRVLVGTQKSGAPLFAYLLKKPRSFWEADQQEIVHRREAMMDGRVYHAEASEDSEERPGGNDKFYAPKTNQIGHASERRRSGAVQRTL